MSDYTKTTNFTAKDSLPSGNAAKVIKGSEFDTEFDNISTAIATKANSASPTLTGTPTAPTAAGGTETTQIATTAFCYVNFVPYSGADTETDLGSQNIKTTNTPSAGADLCNKTYVDAQITANVLPTQTNKEGQYLQSDGTNAAWIDLHAEMYFYGSF